MATSAGGQDRTGGPPKVEVGFPLPRHLSFQSPLPWLKSIDVDGDLVCFLTPFLCIDQEETSCLCTTWVWVPPLETRRLMG